MMTQSIAASRYALRRSPALGPDKPLSSPRPSGSATASDPSPMRDLAGATVPAPLNLPSTGEQVGPRFDSDPRRRHSRNHDTPAAQLLVSDPFGVLTGGGSSRSQRPQPSSAARIAGSSRRDRRRSGRYASHSRRRRPVDARGSREPARAGWIRGSWPGG